MELKALSQVLPSQGLREAYSDAVHKLSGEKPVDSSDVEKFYTQLEVEEGREPDKAALEAIRFHKNFYERSLSQQDLNNIEWFYDPSPNHISFYLTQEGNDRSLISVANNYLAGKFPDNVEPWKKEAIENILKKLRSGESIPPVILSERPKGMRPDGKLYIIDGVHRLLALAIYQLESEGPTIDQKAFIA